METDYGTVTYKSKEIVLTEQAELTDRLMNEYGNDLQYQGDGDTYMVEYKAAGLAGKKKVDVFWNFEIAREGKPAVSHYSDGIAYGYDAEAEDYDWDNVETVKYR